MTHGNASDPAVASDAERTKESERIDLRRQDNKAVRNGSDSGNGVARQISRDDNRPRLLLLAAPAAGRTRIDVQHVRDGEQSDDGQKVGHVQALLAAVRNVLFLGRFFRHV